MSYLKALQVAFVISIMGVLFSGYLSYYELFAPGGCGEAIISCGTKPFDIANVPACVYGFIMYLVLLLVTGSSLLKGRKVKKD